MKGNPYSAEWRALASRSAWAKATRKWLKDHRGLSTRWLAGELGMAPRSIYQLNQHGKTPVWYCEFLGALVAGWAPTWNWEDAHYGQREDVFFKGLARTGWTDMDAEFFFAVAPERWFNAILEKRSNNLPVRLAVMAEAMEAGAVPCGLAFNEWSE